MTGLLEVKNISRRFGGLKAVNGLSFHTNRGEIMGLIGPNGAGKTTAFNLISGTLPASGGRVYFDGEEILGLRASQVVPRGLVRTFQSTNVFRSASAYENIVRAAMLRFPVSFAEGLFNTRSCRDAIARAGARADELLELFELEHCRDTPAGMLAYGLQRRLGVAVAMATKPQMLLMDEPVAGLNPEESSEFAKLVRKLAKLESLTILLVEHHMRFVMGLCDRIVVLDHGEKIAEGTPAEIQANPKVIEAYLGAPDEDDHA